ncbi:MAG: cupin domain-containing protein [Roseibium sp.]|uniref:(R)-mandelonitrile lyase n=1 Tax=Roseibium sp. TaxID=1936156 RepID=UPI001B1BFF52|nr:cupin domain-containing protein [Roseibium sp.]MBO6507860.1 cupin domain-containing protein [Roseibium sp.]MBO6894779.1 cupin domain-containing protein [Roseibium sp.]MBO6929414.1 cupin domain-containing protein [Roseibium sp.]
MSVLTVYKAGSRPTKRASADYFTGTVWQDPVIEAPEPARVRTLRVAFEPGSRTNWHTHPLGQTLQVLQGSGFVQVWGQEKLPILPGDVVWIPPGVKHWHGAGPETAMVHLAIQEALDGSVADWMEPVDDATYRGGSVAGQ